MEIFELRYFLAVAATENIHRASERLRISTGSLSKAVARLEAELGVALFHREGRNIRITDHGRLLQRRASEVVAIEEAARLELTGHRGSLQVRIAGNEALLLRSALTLEKQVRAHHPHATFEFFALDDAKALDSVESGHAHLAITAADPPASLASKALGEARFQVCVGRGHPLYVSARSKQAVPIEEVLLHSFVGPNHAFLGKVGARGSLDGWRDDKFPRQVKYATASYKLMEKLILEGRALAYLPDYLFASGEIEALRITGCPFVCRQKIRLVARDIKKLSWLNRIF